MKLKKKKIICSTFKQKKKKILKKKIELKFEKKKKPKEQITKSDKNQTHGYIAHRANQTPILVKCLLSEVQLVKSTPVLAARSSSP